MIPGTNSRHHPSDANENLIGRGLIIVRDILGVLASITRVEGTSVFLSTARGFDVCEYAELAQLAQLAQLAHIEYLGSCVTTWGNSLFTLRSTRLAV